MFGRRCTLCGGRLDGRGICKECGLDNTKSDKYYRVNHGNCDDKPMTHVHEEKKRKSANYNTINQKKKKPGCLFYVIIVAVALPVLLFLVGNSNELKNSLVNQIGNFLEDDIKDYEEIDPYENLSAELGIGGEGVEYTLESGTYIAGVHIPAGYYIAGVTDEFDVVQVTDMENGIYLYEYLGKEETNYLNDLRIFPGAVVEIRAKDKVNMFSENALTQEMSAMGNPLTEEYEIHESETAKKAGVDFEAGVYDLKVLDGTGTVEIIIKDENNEEFTQYNYVLGEDGSDGMVYRNMIFPKNAEITLFNDVEIVLTPSEKIESLDYMNAYY